ncbi:GNAT family N-acetyltransferase [Schaalia sp. 19OD2882]|uniref:GNAT family N-acetyltransferase n=1 Tax=Schaalia sp. 19OD2882 TaxID=2794089 RepID=UPI001C1EDAA4|nr:GNAT family N-acetyltransferase [Schaalia sp. 19OD2882]QWW20389.1 GNAT family N-acetyltransferase [Schaalia sp. 19OD2882]
MTQRTLQAQLDALADVERPADYEVATLTRYDIPAMAALHVEAYGAPRTAESLIEATDEMRMTFDGVFGTPRDDSFVGAWHEGTLVGALLCVTEPPWEEPGDCPVVLDLVVDPEYRRRGIATALVGEIARRSAAWGHDSLSLRIDARHGAAEKLYDVLGFEQSPDKGD